MADSPAISAGVSQSSQSTGLPPRELWPTLVRRLPQLQYAPALNLADELLDRHIASGHGDRTAIIHGTEAITYAALRRRTAALAAALVRRGIRPGDRVVLHYPNRPDFVVAWLAIQWIGAVGVPIPPNYRRREIEYIVNHAGAGLIVCAPDLAGNIAAARAGFSSGVDLLHGPFAPESGPVPAVHSGPRDDPALLTYIGSADGTLKGVVHSPADLLATADTYARDVLELSPSDVCIGQLSMAWAFGVGGLLVFPLRVGASTVLLDSSGPPLPAAIAASRATVLFAAPTMYRLLLRQPDLESFDLGSLRCAVSAAEPLPAAVVDEWRARTGLEILDGLGTTELCHIFISARPGAVRPGLIGTLVAGYDARIVNEQLAELPRGEAGLLVVRGPTGCRYWRDVDAQCRMVRQGWTLTGDVCIQHGDGWFEHLRRSDDLIVCGGQKVAPAEVERALRDHPDVSEARVFGVADPVRGAVPHATVSLRHGVEPRGAQERLQYFLKRELASYKCPREIHTDDSLAL